MNLTTADKVASQLELMKSAEIPRAGQRALLNSFFNGEAPWKDDEARANQILVNYNDKQGANLLHQARNQLTNAFQNRTEFFRVLLPDCKDDSRRDYEQTITANVTRLMKRSREWYYRQDEVWGREVSTLALKSPREFCHHCGQERSSP